MNAVFQAETYKAKIIPLFQAGEFRPDVCKYALLLVDWHTDRLACKLSDLHCD